MKLTVNGLNMGSAEIISDDFPVMVLSTGCNLASLKRSEFTKHNEEEREIGGYFVINGKERLLRFLIMARRNYVSL